MRTAAIQRTTNEVTIRGNLSLDGSGNTSITTGFEALNHLLTVCAFHGFFDLEVSATGDLPHHIMEDLGIAMGKAFTQALGDKQGIRRYGCFTAAMDAVCVEVAVDISGRPTCHGVRMRAEGTAENMDQTLSQARFDATDFSFQNAEEFLAAFVQHAGISLVYVIKSAAGDLHHILEALFKALGMALDQATGLDPRRRGIPSTKGIID